MTDFVESLSASVPAWSFWLAVAMLALSGAFSIVKRVSDALFIGFIFAVVILWTPSIAVTSFQGGVASVNEYFENLPRVALWVVALGVLVWMGGGVVAIVRTWRTCTGPNSTAK